MSSSGIFGSRAPSYPSSYYSNRSFPSSSALTSPAPYPTSYPLRKSSRFQPQSTYFPPVYTSSANALPAYSSPYLSFPARPNSFENLPYFSRSVYLPVLPYTGSSSEHGLETILIAILVLVSLDLVFIRPLKK